MDEKEAPTSPKPAILGPKGFKAGGATAGIKASGNPDLAAILCDRPATTAAVMTTNLFCGAPVLLARERLEASPRTRGILVNAGVANACTGEKGLDDARAMAAVAEKASGAAEGEFLVASTGVIGRPLPMDKIREATPRLFEGLSEEGWEAFAQAIMTTDLAPKISRRTFRIGHGLHRGPEATVLGVAKGSGMIQPNMATMLAFIVTDYPLGPGQARAMIRRVSDATFNCVTVDGDTSTSDMAILMASGAAASRRQVDSTTDERFEAALYGVAEDLARAIARDGEGATRLIEIRVEGTRNDEQARTIARSVANSSLVKTAMFGHDPNWGRICCAAGYSGVAFDTADFVLKLQGKTVMKHGLPAKFDAAGLAKALDTKEILVQIHVGDGPGTGRVFTCDLTYDYVRINAEYTT